MGGVRAELPIILGVAPFGLIYGALAVQAGLPEILAATGELNLSPLNPRLLAGVAAVLVAWRTRNVWATIVVGMVALLTMQVLLGVQFLMR